MLMRFIRLNGDSEWHQNHAIQFNRSQSNKGAEPGGDFLVDLNRTLDDIDPRRSEDDGEAGLQGLLKMKPVQRDPAASRMGQASAYSTGRATDLAEQGQRAKSPVGFPCPRDPEDLQSVILLPCKETGGY